MSTSDKPDSVQAPADAPREERTVATAAQGSQPEPALPSGAEPTPTGPKPAESTPSGSTPATAPPAAKPAPPKPTAAKPAAATAPAAKPPVIGPTVALPVSGSVPVATAAPATAPEGHEVTSSAPPPWQRVASDTQYVAEHGGLGPAENGVAAAVTPDATTRIGDWGYQRSPRSDAYSAADKAADAFAGHPAPPVVTGTAAASVFAAAAGQSAVRPDARPNVEAGRTTVNFAAPAPPPPPMAAAAPQLGSPTAAVPRRAGRGPRRASLQVKRVDPWSVLKLAFVLSVALFFVWMVAVGVLYGVLDGMGVWDRLNGTYSEFAQGNGGSAGPLITAGRVFGIAAIIGAINIVLFTALATVGSFVYNVSADLAGGLEITLAERE